MLVYTVRSQTSTAVLRPSNFALFKFLGASTSDTIHLNLTGTMLRDLAEMKFDILKDHSSAYRNDNIISPSALSTVGLRRATEARTIKMKNTTGLDLHVLHNLISADQNLGFAAGNAEIVLGHLVEGNTHNQHTMSIRLASTSAAIVGERQPLTDLPITSLSRSNAALYILHPSSSAGLEKRTECDIAYYNAEPVVESCMRNERLRSSVNDVFGLPKGRDLLSSEVWSLDQENNEGAVLKGAFAKEAGGRGRSGEKRGSKSIGNWLKPFLKNDPPEWSDMTCTLRLARDVSKQIFSQAIQCLNRSCHSRIHSFSSFHSVLCYQITTGAGLMSGMSI